MSGGQLITLETGAQLHTRVEGSGPLVALIHGAFSSHRMWQPQIDALSERYTVIAYDLRGFGQSPLAPGRYSNRADLLALLRQLGHDTAHIIGLSLGSDVALEFVVDHPDAARSVVFVSGPAIPGAPQEGWLAEGFAAVERAADEGDFARARELVLQLRPMRSLERLPAVRQQIAQIIDEHPWRQPWDQTKYDELLPSGPERLAGVTVPTLLISGADEVPEWLTDSELIAQRIRGARHIVVADAGHMVNMEQPDEFNRIVLEFLDGLEARQAAEK